MSTILDYLRWRGDVTFLERPFNHVDNLILSLVSYADLSLAVPEYADPDGAEIPVREAYQVFASQNRTDRHSKKYGAAVFGPMAESARFGSALLSCFTDQTEPEAGIQFAAVMIRLCDGTRYVSFRGTDDTTAGWREDFAISYQQTGAQALAASYLLSVMEDHPEDPFLVGGHSKGGNLAVYAASSLPGALQKRILSVFSNDGPGMDPALTPEGYAAIRDKVVRIIPEYSIIGTLYQKDAPALIVESRAPSAILQHDGLYWQVEGDRFVTKNEPDPGSLVLVHTFDRVLSTVPMEEKQKFTDGIFDALESTGRTSLRDLPADGLNGFGTIVLSLASGRSRIRTGLCEILRSFLASLKQLDLEKELKKKPVIADYALSASGLFCVLFPSVIFRILPVLLGVLILVWAVRGLRAMGPSWKRPSFQSAVYLGLFAFSVCLILVPGFGTAFLRFVMGMVLLAGSYHLLHLLPSLRSARFETVLVTAAGSAAALYAVVILVSGLRTGTVFTLGVLVLLFSFLDLVHRLLFTGDKRREEIGESGA